MFIRYSLTASPAEVARRFGVDVPESYQPQYNAGPAQLLPVITDESPQGLSFFYWGAPPSWAREKPLGEKIINTRAELIGEKTVTRKKLREKRCLVPADGIYLWKKTGKKSQIPHRLTLTGDEPFAMAALWEEYEDTESELNHTFSIITTPSSQSVSGIEERMPLILDPSKEKIWLQADEGILLGLLKPYEGTLISYTVAAPLVNSTNRNDPRTVKPAPAADQWGNLSLFD